VHFSESSSIIDMFEDMRAEDYVEALVRQIELGDVEHSICPRRIAIGAHVRHRQGLEKTADGRLGRKMKDAPACDGRTVLSRPQRKKAMTIEAIAFRAACIEARRESVGTEITLVSA
jgi:hypothetical protein